MKLEQIVKLKLNNFNIELSKKDMEDKQMDNPCWEGYEPYGTKEVDGKEVPNCVPIKAKSEEFVIPSPEGGEDEQTFISRCISAIYDEYGESQSAAICYSKWREK